MFIDEKFVGTYWGKCVTCWDVPDLVKTICILPMLQYQMQVNQMQDY